MAAPSFILQMQQLAKLGSAERAAMDVLEEAYRYFDTVVKLVPSSIYNSSKPYDVIARLNAPANVLADLGINIYTDQNNNGYSYIKNFDPITGAGMDNSIQHKSMQNYSFAADDQGNVLTQLDPNYQRAVDDVLFLGRQSTNGVTRGLSDPIIMNNFIPNFAALSSLNPRFNKKINPNYFLGTQADANLFLDQEDGEASEINSKLAQYIPINIISGFDLIKYFKDEFQTTQARNYYELIHPIASSTNYWDSVTRVLKGKVTDLGEGVDNVLNKVLNDATGGLVGGPTNVLTDVLSKSNVNLPTNPDDPYFGVQYHTNVGQIMGNSFSPILQGFANSDPSLLIDPADQQFSIQQYFVNLFSGYPQNVPSTDLGKWFLPYSDPTVFNLEERMKYGANPEPDKSNFVTILNDIQNFNLSSFGTDVVQALGNTADNLVNIGTSLLNDFNSITLDAKNVAQNGIPSIANLLDPGNINTFLSRYIPFAKDKDLLPVWNNTINAGTQGGEAVESRKVYIPVESHKNYVLKHPQTQNAVWNVVDIEKIFEDNGALISNTVLDRYSSASVPNLKNGSDAFILGIKQDAQNIDKLIYEGTQQADGSYNGVSYTDSNGNVVFDPQNTSPNFQDTQYMSNVSMARINKMFNITKGVPTSYDVDPDVMASTEIQYFPFYIRSLNRDDYAIVEQPYYQNGAVFMSKRRVTGNSIVLLDASFDGDMTEVITNQIGKEYFQGRTDPVLQYQGTNRQIGFGFNVVSAKPEDVASNFYKIQELVRMAYPQIQTINEIGSIGYRRAPFVEVRIGDKYLLHGILENVSIQNGGESQLWEILPGGRVPRDYKVQITMALTHDQMPSAAHDFYSPTFKNQVFRRPVNGHFQQG